MHSRLYIPPDGIKPSQIKDECGCNAMNTYQVELEIVAGGLNIRGDAEDVKAMHRILSREYGESSVGHILTL